MPVNSLDAQVGFTTAGAEALCLIGVLFVGALGVYSLMRRGRPKHKADIEHSDPSAPYASMPTSVLEADANAALVTADDALKTSEQELTFATAQYGPEATTAFSAALDAARTEVAEAFRLKQLLDDETPDDDPTRRGWFVAIVGHCRSAGKRLDAQVAAFDQLRQLESNLDTLIPDLERRMSAAVGRLPRISATYDELHAKWAPGALLGIQNSAAQVEERLTFASRSLETAKASMLAGHRPPAALAVRAAEEAIGQIDMLLDGVVRLAADLDTASTSVLEMLNEIESDVAAGRAAVSASTGGAATSNAGTVDLAAAVAGAEQVATSVRADLAAAKPDPFHELRRLETAERRLDDALASIRDAADRAGKARALLESAIPAARAEIASVGNYITTRRGGVGSEARTRLAEAQRNLDEAVALSSSDPVAALAAAQRADAMATEAGRIANDDVNQWSGGWNGGGPVVVGGMGGMGGLGGAVLGGILIDSMLGGRAMNGGIAGWGGRVPGAFGGHRTRVRMRL